MGNYHNIINSGNSQWTLQAKSATQAIIQRLHRFIPSDRFDIIIIITTRILHQRERLKKIFFKDVLYIVCYVDLGALLQILKGLVNFT